MFVGSGGGGRGRGEEREEGGVWKGGEGTEGGSGGGGPGQSQNWLEQWPKVGVTPLLPPFIDFSLFFAPSLTHPLLLPRDSFLLNFCPLTFILSRTFFFRHRCFFFFFFFRASLPGTRLRWTPSAGPLFGASKFHEKTPKRGKRE